MRTVPDTTVGKIEFSESHVTPWTTNAVAIGTSSTTVTAWTAKVTAARAAYQQQQAAQNAAKAATNTLNIAIEQMQPATADIIKQIRVKAATTGNSVYSLAEIPAPATPGPVAAPGKPEEFKVELQADGSLALGWKCKNPAGSNGTIYQVWRKIGSGEFTYVGGAGTKKFVDSTVPVGASSLTYQLQAVRSTAVGPWAQFNVNFGSAQSGQMTVTEAPAVKIAA